MHELHAPRALIRSYSNTQTDESDNSRQVIIVCKVRTRQYALCGVKTHFIKTLN
jgi:hypothetical protein